MAERGDLNRNSQNAKKNPISTLHQKKMIRYNTSFAYVFIN